MMLMHRSAAFAKMNSPLNARVECRAFVPERFLVGLHWHSEEAVAFLGFPISLKEEKTEKFTVKV